MRELASYMTETHEKMGDADCRRKDGLILMQFR